MENEPIIEDLSWLEEVAERWRNTEPGEKQYWLAQIAQENNLPLMKFVMTNKHVKSFDEIPLEYRKILAQKWSIID